MKKQTNAGKIELKKVEVEWVDAQSSLDCCTIDELIEIPVIQSKSCGYLIHKDKEKVILAFMIFGEELIKHYQIIPIKMVKKIKEVKK